MAKKKAMTSEQASRVKRQGHVDAKLSKIQSKMKGVG